MVFGSDFSVQLSAERAGIFEQAVKREHDAGLEKVSQRPLKIDEVGY
jgi:hypothetical protein